MTTFVGTQSNYSDAVKELIELLFDTEEAYDVAIDKTEHAEHQDKLRDFRQDYRNHIAELTKLLEDDNQTAPTGPSGKQWLTKGKVVMADMMGNEVILNAMLDNEEDVRAAYHRMNERDDIKEEDKNIFIKGLEDSMRHTDWLETTLDK